MMTPSVWSRGLSRQSGSMKCKNILDTKKLLNMILSIDSSDNQITKLSLVSPKKIFTHQFESAGSLSEQLTEEITSFLKKNKISIRQIKKITVHEGPGPFSRIRTDIATANALIFSLNLKQKLIKPRYEKAPNITFPRHS